MRMLKRREWFGTETGPAATRSIAVVLRAAEAESPCSPAHGERRCHTAGEPFPVSD